METMKSVGKLITANFRNTMHNTVKIRQSILLKQTTKASLSLVRDHNGKKHLRKLRNIKNNIHHMIRFLMLKFHNNLTGETSMDMTSLARSETKVGADHAIRLHLYKLLNQD